MIKMKIRNESYYGVAWLKTRQYQCAINNEKLMAKIEEMA